MGKSGNHILDRSVPYLILALSICAFYWKICIVEGAWLVSDHEAQHFPWAVHLAKHLKSGALPFWTQMMHSGFPLTAEGQNGAFYLPNLVFYLAFPIEQGYAWNIIFHIMISAVFMFYFMRRLGISEAAALFGTFVYLYGSTLGGAFYNITSLKTLAWFPLTLILGERVLNHKSFAWGAGLLLGFIFSMQLQAGYLQYAAYSILFSCLYPVMRLFDRKETMKLESLMKVVLVFGFAVGLSALLAFPQLFMTYELAMRSNRANPTEGFAYIGSYSPFALACLIFPNIESLFVSKIYLGILPLFFILAGFSVFRKHQAKSVYWLALIALLLALGGWSPLYVAIIKITNFYSFRTPVKFIYFLGFFLCILCAIGVEKVMNRKNHLRKDYRRYLTLLTVVFAGSFAAFLVFTYAHDQLFRIGEWMIGKWIYGKTGHPFSWDFYMQKLDHYIRYAASMLNPMNYSIYVPFMKASAACVAIGLLVSRRIRAHLFYGLAFILLIADLNFSYADIQGDYMAYRDFYKPSPVVRFLRENLDKDRYFLYSDHEAHSPLPVAKNMVYGLHTVNAYSPLVAGDYYRFFDKMGGVNDSSGPIKTDDAFFARSLDLLGMLNVKYVMSDKLLRVAGLRIVFDDGIKWKVYENPFLMNRYSLVPGDEVFQDHDDVLTVLHGDSFDPGKRVLLEEPVARFYGTKELGFKNTVRILSEGEGFAELEVDSSKAQFLLISQYDFPGWEARVNGEIVPIYRANYILQALPLEAGKHKVTLKYRPMNHMIKRVMHVRD